MEGEGKRKEQPKEEGEATGAMATKDSVKGHDDDEDHQQVKVKMSTPSPVAVGNSEHGAGDLKEGEGLDLEGGNNSLSPALPDVGSEQPDVDGAVATTDGSGSPQVKEEFSIYKIPVEIWEQILLNDVKAGKDKAMCCQASTYFDMLLTESKPIWQFKMVFTDVNKYLSLTDILNCRLVCKQWKEDILDAHFLIQSQAYHPYGHFYRNTFCSSADIDRCLQKFDGHSGNPFMDRVVHLDCHIPWVNPEQEFVRKIFQLMDKFGKHIYYLRIRDLFVHPQLFYTILSRILINTPSLRGLNIDGKALNMGVMEVHNNDGENAVHFIDDDYIRELNDTIENRPLPYLPSLETLSFRQFFINCPASLHNAILLPYATGEKPQLKSLACHMDCWQDEYAQGLSSLKDINMKITCNDDLSKLLLINNAPIVDMRLIIMSPATATISFSTLIKVICKFPVEKLQLVLHDGAEFVDDDGEAADLITNMKSEKLWYLHIYHGPKFSYNFLKIFPSLKTLTVGLSKPLQSYLGGEKESEEDVQLYKMMEKSQMYESNIWTLFPDLGRVEISHWHFLDGQFMPQYRFVGTRASCNKYSSQKVDNFPNFCTPFSQKIVALIALSSFAVILQRKFKIF